jgi:hypothetical protein
MNFTPIDDAYKIHHIKNDTYGGFLKYSPICIFCNHNISIPLMNDGGSFRQCKKCKKNFRATVLNQAINNYNYSTNHLKGTN